MKKRLVFITLILFILAAAVTVFATSIVTERTFESNGYLPLDEVMKAAGYSNSGNGTFETEYCGAQIKVHFDFENNVCTKNLYSFDLEGTYILCWSGYYIDVQTVSAVTNKNITVKNGSITASDIDYSPHQWTTEFEPIVAHSGGDVRGGQYTDYYTNSLEAIVQNYDLGFRLFELDFYLTSDDGLALVHDWTQYGNNDGLPPSSEQWKEMQTHGIPKTEGQYYTTMLIGDLLDQMLVNRDMFVITDTKSFEISIEDTKKQFEIIRDEALKRDPELLKRIIPQIYDEQMYELIMDIYDFPDVIYTLYATGSTADRVAEFVSDKDNIKVVTANKEDARFTDDGLAEKLRAVDRLVYVHSLKYYDEFADCAKYGSYGYYAHHLTPADYNVYKTYADN